MTIEILDAATPPEKKSRPRRATMIAAAFLLSLVVGVAYAVIDGAERSSRAARAATAG